MRQDRPKLKIYNNVKHLIKEGDALTWCGTGALSKAIRCWTHRSHVSSIVGKVMAGKQRRLVIEADQGEVNVRLLSKKLLEYDGECYLHRLRPQYVSIRPKVVEFLWGQIGKKYDYRTLFVNMIRRGRVNPSSFICSELTGASYFHPPDEKWGMPSGFGVEVITHMLCESGKQKYVKLLAQGKVLRPGGIALLQWFLPELRLK